MHARKRVRFSEDDLETAINPPVLEDAELRATLLPAPEADEQQQTSAKDEGPIKSTDPGFAAAVRALHRKRIDNLRAGEHLDISLPDDLKLAGEGEEELRFTEDGIPIEPFNLRAEQWGGYFDEDGNYLAYRDQEDTDAWLETLPEGPIPTSNQTFRRAQAELDNIEQRPQMTEDDIQHHRHRIIKRLQRGETVLDALKRLGSCNAPISQEGASRSSRYSLMRSRLAGTIPEANRQAFEALTEDAGQLLNAGDTGIYSQKKEVLAKQLHSNDALCEEVSARSVEPLGNSLATAIEETQLGASPMDSFADDIQMDSAERQSVDSDAAAIAAASQEPWEDRNGLHLANGNWHMPPEATGEAARDGSSMSAQEEDASGFVYDTDSGLYYNSSLGCYFDTQKQLYGDAASGQWFVFEGGQYKTVRT